MSDESLNRVEIELDGDLLGLSALSLPDRLPLADLAGAKHVVLSMQNVLHIDQAGLAMIVRLYSQLSVRGGELTLVDVSPLVRHTLERIGLDRIVPVLGGIERGHERPRDMVVPGAQRET